MKIDYIEADMVIIEFNGQDIITASTFNEDTPGENEIDFD